MARAALSGSPVPSEDQRETFAFFGRERAQLRGPFFDPFPVLTSQQPSEVALFRAPGLFRSGFGHGRRVVVSRSRMRVLLLVVQVRHPLSPVRRRVRVAFHRCVSQMVAVNVMMGS